MQRHRYLKLPAFAVAIAIALASCQSPQPLPGATAAAVWQKRFKALDCWNPRYSYTMPSTDPLLLAMIVPCRHTSIRRQTSGWDSLVIIEGGRDHVTGIPISPIYNAGVHFTRNGDVVWYSSGKIGEAAKTQKYAEAYVLRKGGTREQLLGHIDLPFVVGPGIGFLEGEGCHLVTFNAFRANDKSPYLREHFLVNDDEPFASAKRLDGVGRALFWDPVRHRFVLQTQPYRVLGRTKDNPLERRALDCSGQMGEIDAELARRLAPITDENATYSVSRKGDLVVSWEKVGSHETEIVVFHGAQTDRIVAGQSFAGCPDLACEPFYEMLFAGPWSRSGDYFMIDRSFSGVEVYRASDMQVVKRWEKKDSGDFPAHGFINDHTAYQFNDHSRLSFQTW